MTDNEKAKEMLRKWVKDAIAAEKLSRRCYAMELAPEYCDVTVERWEQWTGGKAELLKK